MIAVMTAYSSRGVYHTRRCGGRRAHKHRAAPLNAPRLGRLTRSTDRKGQVSGFQYDLLDRRTQAGHGATSTVSPVYTYDAAGQRTGMGGSLAATDLPADVPTTTYDADNRLTNWNGQALSYDDNGNLQSDGANTYTWNSRDQLVALAGATSASFAYDGLGRRKSKTVNGVSTAYLYDGMNPIQEQSGATIQANLLAGPGLDQWFARTQGGQTVSYLPDALGSTLALANASQALTTSYTYEPYGKTTTSGAATGNTFAYTGRENDGTGLYYYRARYYQPTIGRFVSPDPIGIDGGINLYGYVEGDPIGYVDPDGLAKQKPNYTPNNPRKPVPDHKKPDGRQRNMKPDGGEEHSRRPKGGFRKRCLPLFIWDLLQEMCEADPNSGACFPPPPNCGNDDGKPVPCET